MEAQNDANPTLVNYEPRGRYAAAVTANILQDISEPANPRDDHIVSLWNGGKRSETNNSDTARPKADSHSKEMTERPETGLNDAHNTQMGLNNAVGLLTDKRSHKAQEKTVKDFSRWQKTTGGVEKNSPKRGKHTLTPRAIQQTCSRTLPMPEAEDTPGPSNAIQRDPLEREKSFVSIREAMEEENEQISEEHMNEDEVLAPSSLRDP